MLRVRHEDIQLAQMMNLRDCANEILVFSVDKIQPKTCQPGKRSPIGFGRSRRTNSFRGDVQRLEGRCIRKECLEQTPQGWGKRRVKLANLQFRKAALVRREAGCTLKLSQLRQRGEEKLAVFVDEDIEGRTQGLESPDLGDGMWIQQEGSIEIETQRFDLREFPDGLNCVAVRHLTCDTQRKMDETIHGP